MNRPRSLRTHKQRDKQRARHLAATLLMLGLPLVAMAVPPDWAPAHGWRQKHDPNYAGYSGRHYRHDFGITTGRCDHAAIGAALGALAGGALGNGLAGTGAGTGERSVAIVAGTVLGAALGAEIGRRMDKADRACVGQALELAGSQQTIAWTNARTRVSYQLTPLPDKYAEAGACRRFRLLAHDRAGLSEGRTTACIDGEGSWRLAPEIRLSRR